MFIKIIQEGGKNISFDGVSISHLAYNEVYDLPEWHAKRLVASKVGVIPSSEDLTNIAKAVKLAASQQNGAVAAGQVADTAGDAVTEAASATQAPAKGAAAKAAEAPVAGAAKASEAKPAEAKQSRTFSSETTKKED